MRLAPYKILPEGSAGRQTSHWRLIVKYLQVYVRIIRRTDAFIFHLRVRVVIHFIFTICRGDNPALWRHTHILFQFINVHCLRFHLRGFLDFRRQWRRYSSYQKRPFVLANPFHLLAPELPRIVL